jgi:hypothetical protein
VLQAFDLGAHQAFDHFRQIGQVLSIGRMSSLTTSSIVRPLRTCAVWASVLKAAPTAAVVAAERRPCSSMAEGRAPGADAVGD